MHPAIRKLRPLQSPGHLSHSLQIKTESFAPFESSEEHSKPWETVNTRSTFYLPSLELHAVNGDYAEHEENRDDARPGILLGIENTDEKENLIHENFPEVLSSFVSDIEDKPPSTSKASPLPDHEAVSEDEDSFVDPLFMLSY